MNSMILHIKIRVLCYFLILTFIISSLALGQDNELEIFKEIKELRTLNGHYFTPSNTIKYPFILTHVRMSLGLGEISDIKYPLVEVGDEQYFFLQGEILAALLSFEYQHAVKEWLALYVRLGLIGRIGSDFGSLLVQGVNYSATFDIGWMIQTYRGDDFALSTSVGVTNGNYSIINLNNFIDDIINKVPNASLTKSNNSLYGLLGIKAAYGFSKFFGLNFLADLGYGETIQRELENKWFTTIGINADMNFVGIIKTPLALSIGYLFSNYPKNNDEVIFNRNIILTQISYIGRTNFILSLDLSASRELAGTHEETFWLKTAQFSMRYLF